MGVTGREGLGRQELELVVSGMRVWNTGETRGLVLLQTLGGGVLLPAQAYLVVRVMPGDPRG